MKKGEIIMRTMFCFIYGMCALANILGQIDKGEWWSFAGGASFCVTLILIANHIHHLIHDDVRKDGDGE